MTMIVMLMTILMTMMILITMIIIAQQWKDVTAEHSVKSPPNKLQLAQSSGTVSETGW